MLRSVLAYFRVARQSKAIGHQFERLGLTPDILAARGAELEAATPSSQQVIGQSYPVIAEANARFLALIEQLPAGAGFEATLQHLRAAAARETGSR